MAPSSCTAKISISVVAVCLIFAALGFAVWKFKLNKTNTETNQEHKTDGETNTSKSNETDNTEKEKKPLMKTQTHPKKDVKVESREKETKTTSSMDSDNIPADSNVIVDEVDPNGKFVRLKNKSSEKQLLANWKMDIKVNKGNITYTLPAIFLDPGNVVTIWACDGGGNVKSPSDLVWKEQKSWGIVDEVTLKGPTGEKRAMMKISHP
ncbi:lamin-A-like [Morone saxatilis]|uniref:lamin-A-like n=1 Tax=Morone saxatilis TaxID=34816 RepID=UPI0015E20566|nr:lamin-A-like [Morone saxatilis]